MVLRWLEQGIPLELKLLAKERSDSPVLEGGGSIENEGVSDTKESDL